MPNLGQTIFKSKLNKQDIYDKIDGFGNTSATMSLEDLNDIESGNIATNINLTTPPPSREGFLRKNSTQINAGLDLAKDLTGVIGRGQSTFNGPKGDIRAGIEEGWNSISDTVANFGPYGQIASMAMKATGVLNNIQGAIFGATDGMTTKDAIFDSPLGFLTGVGWLNQAGGKASHTITKDNESFETVGASYGGTGSLVDDALTKSGKKYGLFSRGERKQANSEIAEATRLQNIMTNIANNATDRFNIRNSMSAINGNSRAFSLAGGYDLSAIRAGKEGLKLLRLEEVRHKVEQYRKEKRKLEIQRTDPFEIYLQSLPENLRDTVNYRARDYWEFNGRPKNFEEAITKGMFTFLDDGFWHGNSVLENPNTGEIEFMKSDTHPTHQLEVDWYNSDDGALFRLDYELVKSSPYWKYVRRETPKEFKEGGSINVTTEIFLTEATSEFKEGGAILSPVTYIELTLETEEFKEGGSINVIPDGALHAHKHHMDVEGITSKGIPVISEKEGGEIEQQAEIEKEEIIFRLEVTKKLEELAQDGSDEAAIEAGKLLVNEILYNTVDKTNNLL